MKKLVKEVISDTRGSFVEYIILTGVVALFGIAAYTRFGDSIDTKVKAQATRVTNIR